MIKKFKILWGMLILILIVLLRSLLILPDDKLRIIACNVGQGDGLLITQKNIQIVIDGGPNNAISSCVANHMPFWDREIEMIVLTNPDFDHYFGLIELVKHYNVNLFVANPIEKKGEEYKALTDAVLERGISIANPLTGTQFKLGELIFDFVWPIPQAISAEYEASRKSGVLGVYTSSRAVNELSLVFNLKYGEFDALFTGDIVPESLDEVIATGKIYDIDYLKVPHHGSKNGLNQELLDASRPEVAVISDGKNNRYGHPSEEVLKMLNTRSVRTLRTDQQGEIEVITDGISWWIR